MHMMDKLKFHTCGGVILSGDGLLDNLLYYDYCNTCGAFRHNSSDDFPTGTNKEENRQAWDLGEDCSPDSPK